MRGRCLRLLAACVLAGLAGPALAEAPVPTLLQPFEVVDTARRPLEPGQGLRVVLRFRADQAGKGNELSRRLRKAIGADGHLVLGDVAYPVSRDKVEARHRRWRRADAALPESLGVAYLPLGLWEDEGPGYAFSSSAVSVFLYLQGIRIEVAAP
jgi:hypothetical protein